jgi:hypothetical protein
MALINQPFNNDFRPSLANKLETSGYMIACQTRHIDLEKAVVAEAASSTVRGIKSQSAKLKTKQWTSLNYKVEAE